MQFNESDQRWMRQALYLAIAGRGQVEPNPMVGCIIVKDGRLIGKGFHERFGQPHAEINALASCTESPVGARAYVTLEPCCHTNKKTPPCVPALIAAKIRRVLVGCTDPNPAVSNKGIQQLREAGIVVIPNVCQAEAQQLNAAFFAHMVRRVPYITLKWAESADGLVAGAGGRTVRISNSAATSQIHAMRSRCDAILVGINTALRDDPLLTARVTPPLPFPRPLRRIVLDTHLRLPMHSRLVQTAPDHETWVFCSYAAEQSPKATSLRNAGVGVLPCGTGEDGRLQLSSVRTACNDITHLLVEPGPSLAASFLQAELADRIWVIRSPKIIGEANAARAPIVPWPPVATVDIAGDTLTEYVEPGSYALPCPQPISA